jgi:hypothetical protein
VGGVALLYGTLLLEFKPYVPPFDAIPIATLGWLKGRV